MTEANSNGENEKTTKRLDNFEELTWWFFRTIGTSRSNKYTASFIFDFLCYSGPNYRPEETEEIKRYQEFLSMPYEESSREIEEALNRLVARGLLKMIKMKHKGKKLDDLQYKRPVYMIYGYKLV